MEGLKCAKSYFDVIVTSHFIAVHVSFFVIFAGSKIFHLKDVNGKETS